MNDMDVLAAAQEAQYLEAERAEQEQEMVAALRHDDLEPPAGSWASVARMMAKEFPDEGIDWDAWKEEMKDEMTDF
jgi:hypothetical protein